MNKQQASFVKTVYDYYATRGRHDLPWRKTKHPYRIAVSEVMLQQTQVARVKEKYVEFLKLFPTVHALAEASLVDILKVWTGLGYNRRARFLKMMAETIMADHAGVFPKTVTALEALPGIGHYTARAIATFAYDQPHVFIETNIRTVYMHHFFPQSATLIPDTALMPIINSTLDQGQSRVWYWALMDYGSFLKANGITIHRKTVQYKKQSAFKGSVREVRGVIIKVLANGPQTVSALRKKAPFDTPRFNSAITQLTKEHLIEKKGNKYQIKTTSKTIED